MLEINSTSLYKSYFMRFIVILLGLPIAIFFESRAFVVGLIVACWVNWQLTNKSKTNKKHSFVLGLIVAFMAFVLAFVFKLNSSLGRLFIYKISFQLFEKNWLYGVGPGNFKSTYLFQQADYFAKGNFTENEQQLADNTFYAFNDYWQFIVETGVIGGVLLALVLFFIVNQIYIASKNQRFIVLKSIVTSLLVSIMIAAFFTHIFENKLYQYSTILAMMTLVLVNNLNKTYRNVYLVLVSVLFVWILSQSILKYQTETNYKKAMLLYMAGLKEDSLMELNIIRPIEDNKRAVLYLQLLLSNQYLTQENEIILLAKKYPNAQIYKLLGDYYATNRSYQKAANAYTLAINMVPNRFVPRQSLLQLYVSQNKLVEAVEVAEQIVKLKVKVSSNQVNAIKLEAVEFLKNYQ